MSIRARIEENLKVENNLKMKDNLELEEKKKLLTIKIFPEEGNGPSFMIFLTVEEFVKPWRPFC